MSFEPAQRPRRRRGRTITMSLFAVFVLAILLLFGDRVGNAVAENDMADQFTANGLAVKPSVTIEGFPFLTQLVAHDLRRVDVSASSIPAGPVTITRLTVTLTGLRFNSSFSGASVDQASATLFVSFGALAAAGEISGGTGVTITPEGPARLKISASVGGIAVGALTASVVRTGPRRISIRLLRGGSGASSLLSSFGAFSFTLPQGIPPSLRITGLTLDAQGLTLSAAATNATFTR